jgi:hypothetical protein
MDSNRFGQSGQMSAQLIPVCIVHLLTHSCQCNHDLRCLWCNKQLAVLLPACCCIPSCLLYRVHLVHQTFHAVLHATDVIVTHKAKSTLLCASLAAHRQVHAQPKRTHSLFRKRAKVLKVHILTQSRGANKYLHIR